MGEITVRNYYTAWLSVYVKYVNVHTHVDYGTGKTTLFECSKKKMNKVNKASQHFWLVFFW